MNDSERRPKSGDRVTWKYSTGSKYSKCYYLKQGEYHRLIKHTRKHKGNQLAWVLFDGNRKVTAVPVDDLKVITNA